MRDRRSRLERGLSLPRPRRAIGLGRTRIGIETGVAIVGDVGIQSKLDYTAHGDAVNMAARLQACNKELGSAICVGPCAAARCGAPLLRPLGRLAIRGREEPIAVFEPWPSNTPPAWREAYLKAYAMLDCDAANAALLLQKLMAERPADSAVRRLAEPLTSIGKIGSSVPIADDQRTPPELTGEVIRVSPDVNTDQRSGQSTTPFVSRCRRTNWRPRGA